MENRFIDFKSSPFSAWVRPFSAAERALVILIENGGVDLGIPELVDAILASMPGASLLPGSLRDRLKDFLRDKIRTWTDNLVESFELTVNRYSAAKPDFYSEVDILRNGKASYQALKDQLFSLSRAGKVIDLLILTHGSNDFISVEGGINGDKIRAMKTEFGKPLSIRSVYMMNCVGSSLNQAWLDAGAKVSSGALHNNYLPEPSMYFFWKNWKGGQTFEEAVTGAYRKTIATLKSALVTFISEISTVGGLVADQLDIESLDFVKDSAPVIQGQRSLTINSDSLTFSQSLTSGLATTVLSAGFLKALSAEAAAPAQPQTNQLSPQGVEFIKRLEGFMPRLYNDPLGHCTIGYGTKLHEGPCDGRSAELPYASGIDESQAASLLLQRAAEFQKAVNSLVTVPLNQNQFDSLVSFVYNIGAARFARSTLLRLLNQGDYASVPGEMKRWTKAHQNGAVVDLPGLVRRRQAEADLFQRPPIPAAAAQSLSRLGAVPVIRR